MVVREKRNRKDRRTIPTRRIAGRRGSDDHVFFDRRFGRDRRRKERRMLKIRRKSLVAWPPETESD